MFLCAVLLCAVLLSAILLSAILLATIAWALDDHGDSVDVIALAFFISLACLAGIVGVGTTIWMLP